MYTHIITISDLKQKGANAFAVTPSSAELAEIVEQLGATGLRKVRFIGEIRAEGKAGWTLVADLGATVIQSCVISLLPVTTRIDQNIRRRFIPQEENETAGAEIQYLGDDELETLSAEFDLVQIMIESLALLMPEYPRADGAQLEATTFTEPGQAPLQDADVKPFAALAALKDKMQE